MIKNQIIVDKLAVKTKGDPDMRGFISDILERESEGKHYAFDFLEHFAVADINVVILQYIISALYTSEGTASVNKLFDLIIENIVKYRSKKEPFVLIINDVNSINMGRDLFLNIVSKLQKAAIRGVYHQFYFNGNIQNVAQMYGTKHENNIAMSNEMASKYSRYEPWQYCTSAQLLIEIGR